MHTLHYLQVQSVHCTVGKESRWFQWSTSQDRGRRMGMVGRGGSGAGDETKVWNCTFLITFSPHACHGHIICTQPHAKAHTKPLPNDDYVVLLSAWRPMWNTSIKLVEPTCVCRPGGLCNPTLYSMLLHNTLGLLLANLLVGRIEWGNSETSTCVMCRLSQSNDIQCTHFLNMEPV